MVALTGGLNTRNTPPRIDPDQLQEATGMEYRPPRSGLFATAGRSRADYGATAIGGSRINGLTMVTYDNAPGGPYAIAFTGASSWVGSAEADGRIQFAHLVTGNNENNRFSGTTAIADVVHYGNNFFAWNGADANLSIAGASINGNRIWQQHGMIAVTASGSAIATGVSSTLAAATYDLWYTEVNSGTNTESAYTGTPTSITLSASGLAIEFTLPSSGLPTNTQTGSATVFGNLYCTIAGQKYPFGYVNIAQINIANGTTFTITAENTSTNAFTNAGEVYQAYPIYSPPGGVAVSRNGQPPTAYDMTVFQDSLVCIDADDRQLLKYSMPDFPHLWPATQFIPFETDWQDDLNAIIVVNNALLVFHSFYGFRVDDLPRATDGDDFAVARSRAKEPFAWGHGCIGQKGKAKFNIFGSGELCLFVCRDGIHITDGFKMDYASLDLDWVNTVDIPSLNLATLLNNPKFHRIEFRYADKADNTKWKRLDFYYHPMMLRPSRTSGFPRLPILGPYDVPGPVAALNELNGDWQVWAGHKTASSIWIEGTGTSDGANLVDGSGTINKRWKTKNFYPFGQGAEADIVNVFTQQSETTASGSYTLTGLGRLDDERISTTVTGTIDQSLVGSQPHPDLHQRSQMFNVRGAKDDGGAWQELNYLILVVDKAGKLNPTKSNV